MKMKTISRQRRGVVIFAMLLMMAALLYACGSGGGGGSAGTGGVASAGVYITDDMNRDYQQVIVTIYKIEFERAQDKTLVTAFEDSLGVSYDIHELHGLLEHLGSLPAGSYSKVLVTVGKQLIITDSNGQQITPNPAFEENAWTSCSQETCVIEISGAANIVSQQKVILDFDLKQFRYDPSTNTVRAKIVLDADGSGHDGYQEMKIDDYELKGVVQSVADDSFEISIIKVEHFAPPSNIVTVVVNSDTQYGCDDDDHRSSCPISGLEDIQAGMTLEVKGAWNSGSSTFEAYRIEVDEDDDIAVSACTIPDRSISDFSNLIVQPKLEQEGNAVSYAVDSGNYSIQIAGRTILITRETVIEDETSGAEAIICADEIPSSAHEVSVRYYSADYQNMQNQYVAYKISLE
jgi:hypothetical protein